MTIGLTGGIGAGKSLISKILESMFYPVFNSDNEAKYLIESNLEIRRKISNLLGQNAYNENGYNRQFVASVVFKNEVLLNELNSIIHPEVRKAFKYFSSNSNSKLVFNEAAILFETGAYKTFDKTILVCANEDLRIRRIAKRDNSTEEEIKARFSKQWSDEQKRPLANYIIENNEQESVLLQLNNILEELNRL
jgi:dephospho-CoA kinase